MSYDLSLPSQLIAALTPDVIMMVGAMFLLLWAAWGKESDERQRCVGIAAIGVCVISAATVIYFMCQGFTATSGAIAVDNFRWVCDLVFLAGTIATLALSIEYNKREGILAAESHVLVLFASSGMMILAAARDITIVFLGIELMSIAVYILTGINRRSGKSAEAAIKYFLLGAFSTAFLLYGLALVYGATGSTNLEVMGSRIQELGLSSSPMLLAGIALMLIGFGFKVAAAPFHMWAPDVYDGAPAPITAFMASAVKAAAFAGLIRIWFEAFGAAFAEWHSAIWWLAAITMVVGNFVALVQRNNIKRMLAYSSIAHAGYILVVLTSGQSLGSSAFLFYIVAYTLATFGAFAVVTAVSNRGERNISISDYAGLWNVRPWLAVAMAVFMLAMLGFPIFGGAGFFAKWYIIQAALQSPSPQIRIAVVLVLTSVVSAGYYLYVVKVMFMEPRAEDAAAIAPTGRMTSWVIGLSAVLLLVLGIFPNALVNLTRKSEAPLNSPYASIPLSKALTTAPK